MTGHERPDEASDEQAVEFQVPASYTIEPELAAPAPRRINPAFRDASPPRQKDRLFRRIAMVVASICLLASFMPVLNGFGPDMLPLNWLQVVAIGLVSLTTLATITGGHWGRVEPWLREGEVLQGRIEAIDLYPTAKINGVDTSWVFAATVTYRDPDTGDLEARVIPSEPLIGDGSDMKLTFGVGDYVTILRRRKKNEWIWAVYGFLRTRADVGIVPKDPTAGFWKRQGGQAVIAVGVAFGLLAAVVVGIRTRAIYEPIHTDSSSQITVDIVGAVLGLVVFVLRVWTHDRRVRTQASAGDDAVWSGGAFSWGNTPILQWRSPKRLVMVAVLGLMTSAFGFAILDTIAMRANAWLDDSPGQERPVVISEWRSEESVLYVTVVHKLHYEFADESGDEKKWGCSRDIARYTPDGPGVAIVRHGAFGWPWVESIYAVAEEPSEGR